MTLSEETVLLEHALTRGQFILRLFGCPAVHRQLSNTRGLAKGQVDPNRKHRRAIRKAQGPVSAAGTALNKGSM